MPDLARNANISAVPVGYTGGYTAKALEGVEELFNHHPERHHALLYDSIADDLRDGVYVPFPAGANRDLRPASITFKFEKHEYMVLLPQPHDSVRRVLICPKILEDTVQQVDEYEIARAARLFTEAFISEYERYNQTALVTALLTEEDQSE